MNKYKYIIFDLDWTLINSTDEIFNILENYFLENYPSLYDTARYCFRNTQWQGLKEQLEFIFNDKKKVETETKVLYNILWNLKNKVVFFPWVKEKIKELYEKWYKLFLTTWNSTKFAKQTLKDWWIYEYFEKILWSEDIPKWKEHLEIFKETQYDNDFYKKSLYIWDWDMDKLFAQEVWINFVRVWSKWKGNENIVKNIVEIDKYLK